MRTASGNVSLYRYFLPLLRLLIFAMAPVVVCAAPQSTMPDDAAWAAVLDLGWDNGFDSRVAVQANPGAVEIVSDPADASRKVLRAKIERGVDYAHVANGTPRAEVLIRKPATFSQNSDYLVRWSTYLPRNFEFDSKQLVIISQIHQSSTAGGPTVALTLLGANYYISTRGGAQVQKTTAGARLCCAEDDRGKWVHWALRYFPDETGKQSLTELWKDGQSVFRSEHVANAYIGDESAYLKIGLYKSAWEKEPSDVEAVTILYGPISIRKR
jgi:hypothetical protein